VSGCFAASESLDPLRAVLNRHVQLRQHVLGQRALDVVRHVHHGDGAHALLELLVERDCRRHLVIVARQHVAEARDVAVAAHAVGVLALLPEALEEVLLVRRGEDARPESLEHAAVEVVAHGAARGALAPTVDVVEHGLPRRLESRRAEAGKFKPDLGQQLAPKTVGHRRVQQHLDRLVGLLGHDARVHVLVVARERLELATRRRKSRVRHAAPGSVAVAPRLPVNCSVRAHLRTPRVEAVVELGNHKGAGDGRERVHSVVLGEGPGDLVRLDLLHDRRPVGGGLVDHPDEAVEQVAEDLVLADTLVGAAEGQAGSVAHEARPTDAVALEVVRAALGLGHDGPVVAARCAEGVAVGNLRAAKSMRAPLAAMLGRRRGSVRIVQDDDVGHLGTLPGRNDVVASSGKGAGADTDVDAAKRKVVCVEAGTGGAAGAVCGRSVAKVVGHFV